MGTKDTSWDVYDIDVDRLLERASLYGQLAGASLETRGWMYMMLASPAGRYILSMSRKEMLQYMVNDAYKAKMHKVYAKYYSGVIGDFALNVRRTILKLEEMQTDFPALFEELHSAVAVLCSLTPYPDKTRRVLKKYFDFETDEAMLRRAQQHGVTSNISWLCLGEGDRQQLVAIANGPIESVSHVETSFMQLVQEYTVRAQAHKLARATGVKLDRTERLANSLGKLAGSITRLNAAADRTTRAPVKIALFAGRRASDRTFLMLQNLFCLSRLKNYMGTSSIAAVECLEHVLQEHPAPGVQVKDGRICNLALVGTHAHEMQSVTQQLLSQYDEEGGDGCAAVCISSLLAHLLFLSTNGGLSSATALADTFGTQAFLAAAMAADVPKEFIDDMASHSDPQPAIPEGAKVFDLLRMWRLDSGDYKEIAPLVLAAWKQRCMQLEVAGCQAPPRPMIMHSNLESVDECIEMIELDEDIRPVALGFGTLLDGFIPFQADPASSEVCSAGPPTLEMVSVVMKAVQARLPQATAGFPSPKSASKLGDTDGKIQVDPRLDEQERFEVLEGLQKMKLQTNPDPEKVSRALAAGYHAVTRLNILGEKLAA
mmetsp:Transcript_39795/g.112908  ORF Transcript_39795/g.112908 Transcript_39795/m.112908 type:complete len:600 (-) Transcript_39795:234-2033(-)